ncbi:phosphoribosyl-dephospho-CoA transferase [Tardiphaga robiniae]|uniref:malonate decarboxylase holo-[acyl-carrier-protein] synthase n=1 Tax=Tardiphaga robiniae TaxID=943830 RepID=UPI002864BEA8|nr:malonate decarboxylase holo-[acyl-carrier-protein] synthase [Tardiphaga robiniae]MDR6661303.1 phosphoribosyl-dephospho-CoA transferase [Tardiphaga robiniae]
MTKFCNHIEAPLRRHDLVFVSQHGWRAMIEVRDDLASDPLIARWAGEGWPTIRRRALPDETSGLPLGLPLPPSAGKRRVSLLSEQDDVVSVARPPSLDHAMTCAPQLWCATLYGLVELSNRHAIDVRVFGSLAWRTLTGLNYVTDRSDLDLLFDIRPGTDLDLLTAELAALETAAPMRLDGELMREDGPAVNWREFHDGTPQVLAKNLNGIALVDRYCFASGRSLS